MSATLIVEKADGGRIALEDWRALVESDPRLRLRTEPLVAVNPATGAKISIPVGEADAEWLDAGEWVPFLRFKRGRLVTEYAPSFDDPDDDMRGAIVGVVRRLDARICSDLEDEPLAW